MVEHAVIEVKGLTSVHALQLRIFNLQGTQLLEMNTAGTAFDLKKVGLPSGIYLFQVLQEGKFLGSGKLAVQP